MLRTTLAFALALAAWLPACSDSGDAADVGADGGDVGNVDGGATDVPPDSPADTGGDDATDDASAEPDTEVACTTNSECDDDNACTEDLCIENVCDNSRSIADPADETAGDCRRITCVDGELMEVVDETDVPADDGIGCTLEVCDDGEPASVPTDALCDDGDRCNGIETCTMDGCENGPAPLDPEADSDGDGVRDCEDAEECDGLDNDGDGIVDNNLDREDLGDACYTGPITTEGVGECRGGSIDCVNGQILCDGEVLPEPSERCDGRDNDCDGVIPEIESDRGCTPNPTVTSTPATVPLEVNTSLGLVDVQFNIDTTGSMSGVLDSITTNLTDVIVPGIESAIPVAAYGVSTFEDFPFGSFGSSRDLPFELQQRVTTRVDHVETALENIELGSGGDGEESGVESIYQICNGEGVQWPSYILTDNRACGPGGKAGPVGVVASGESDWYRVDVDAGQVVEVAVYADCAEGADTTLEIWQGLNGTRLDSDSAAGPAGDPRLVRDVEEDAEWFIKVAASGFSSTSWYLLEVRIDGVPMLPATGICADGASMEEAVELFDADIVGSTYDVDACLDDCTADSAIPVEWAESFCLGGIDDRFEDDVCGNGITEEPEECDDANFVEGDSCDAMCMFETSGVVDFQANEAYVPGFGHGLRGGVGFREGALPVVVHFTDQPSHEVEDYLGFSEDIGAHSAEEMLRECEKIGVRVIGVANSSSLADAPIDDLYNLPGLAVASNATVPTCAFDGTLARTNGSCAVDECCTGQGGAGREPTEDGVCPLVFEITSRGDGLPDAIIAAIETLSRFATFRISPVLRNHPLNGEADALCMMHGIEVAEVNAPSDCSPEPLLVDGDGDGTRETIRNGVPGTRVTYDFTIGNVDALDRDADGDREEPCVEPGVYRVIVDIEAEGGALLESEVMMLVVEE